MGCAGTNLLWEARFKYHVEESKATAWEWQAEQAKLLLLKCTHVWQSDCTLTFSGAISFALQIPW